MNFKIDTKENYTLLTPDSTCLDENLTAALQQKWTELSNNGPINIIVDLNKCESASDTVMDALVQLHELAYNEDQSLVFTDLKSELRIALSDHEYYHAINIAPTMIEAIDIIKMEVLQRDMFGDDEAFEA